MVYDRECALSYTIFIKGYKDISGRIYTCVFLSIYHIEHFLRRQSWESALSAFLRLMDLQFRLQPSKRRTLLTISHWQCSGELAYGTGDQCGIRNFDGCGYRRNLICEKYSSKGISRQYHENINDPDCFRTLQHG